MSKYFRPVPKLNIDAEAILKHADEVCAMTDAEYQRYLAESEIELVTHEDRLRFIEHVEKNHGGRISWDMPYSFDEYARRVRAGEDL